jgi:hypothetical protein
VVRYDRAAGGQVLDAFAERALALGIGLDDWGSMFRADGLFEAAAVVDPARAAAMIDSLPEPSGLSSQELKNGSRSRGSSPGRRTSAGGIPSSDCWRSFRSARRRTDTGLTAG